MQAQSVGVTQRAWLVNRCGLGMSTVQLEQPDTEE